MIPMTVTIAGWTGDEAGPDGPNLDEMRRRLWTQLEQTHPGVGERYYSAGDQEAGNIIRETGMAHMFGFFIARAHRDAAHLANELTKVRAEANRAAQQAATEYADLSKNTTINWLAAHHRFVLTTQNARELLERSVEIGEDLQQHRGHLTTEPASLIYAEHVPAEHRITMPDLDALKTQLAEFVEISTNRFATTRATITGGYPAGFEPTPIDPEPFEPGAGEEIAWMSATYNATPAVVASERSW